MDRRNKRDRARANDYQPVKMFQEPLWSAERNVNERKAKRTQKSLSPVNSKRDHLLSSRSARGSALFFALVYRVSRSPRKLIIEDNWKLYSSILRFYTKCLFSWIIEYCNSREKWWGEGRGCNQNPSNTCLVTEANEYNRGELTLHPEQENPGGQGWPGTGKYRGISRLQELICQLL